MVGAGLSAWESESGPEFGVGGEVDSDVGFGLGFSMDGHYYVAQRKRGRERKGQGGERRGGEGRGGSGY